MEDPVGGVAGGCFSHRHHRHDPSNRSREHGNSRNKSTRTDHPFFPALPAKTVRRPASFLRLPGLHSESGNGSPGLCRLRRARKFFPLVTAPPSLRNNPRPRCLRSRSRCRAKMETFFAYSRTLKKEREKRSSKVPGFAQPRPPSGTPCRTALEFDPRKFLLLASVCQSLDR